MLPIYLTFDSGLDDYERHCLKDAMVAFKELFPERAVYTYGDKAWATGDYSCADWYIRFAKKIFTPGYAGIQLDADDLLRLIENEPWQKKNPHIDVFFTSYDLNVEGMNFCFGLARGRNTVQSVYRFKKLDSTERKLALQTLVWHELGHIFGMASDSRRSHTKELLGRHCTNLGCSMCQGVTVDEWVSNAKMVKYSGKIYCPQCMEDMLKTKI